MHLQKPLKISISIFFIGFTLSILLPASTPHFVWLFGVLLYSAIYLLSFSSIQSHTSPQSFFISVYKFLSQTSFILFFLLSFSLIFGLTYQSFLFPEVVIYQSAILIFNTVILLLILTNLLSTTIYILTCRFPHRKSFLFYTFLGMSIVCLLFVYYLLSWESAIRPNLSTLVCPEGQTARPMDCGGCSYECFPEDKTHPEAYQGPGWCRIRCPGPDIDDILNRHYHTWLGKPLFPIDFSQPQFQEHVPIQ